MFSEDLVYLVIKYLLEGVAVSISAYYLTSKKTSIQEVILVGVSAATIFLLLGPVRAISRFRDPPRSRVWYRFEARRIRSIRQQEKEEGELWPQEGFRSQGDI